MKEILQNEVLQGTSQMSILLTTLNKENPHQNVVKKNIYFIITRIVAKKKVNIFHLKN